MGVIRFPMSPGDGWRLIALYSEYLKIVQQHLDQGRPFEAIAISCLALDVLLHQMLDGLETHHKTMLDDLQRDCVSQLRARPHTAGQVIRGLDETKVLDRRLLRALSRLNEVRNLLVHPTTCDGLKKGAIIPISHGVSVEHNAYAAWVYRLLCHIVDVAGGGSPLKDERYRGSFLRSLRRLQQCASHASETVGRDEGGT